MLDRDQFCSLLKISSDDLKNRTRRNLNPFGDGERVRGIYYPLEVLLTYIVDDLCGVEFGMNRAAAAHIVGIAAQSIMVNLDRIAETSLALFYGKSTDEILCRVVWSTADAPAVRSIFVGTEEEINVGAFGLKNVRYIGFNVSRAATVLRIRAEREDINLSDFWKDEA